MVALLALSTTLLVDAAKSSVQFSVQHIYVERVTGTVPVAGGSVTLFSGSVVPTAVTARLDATKINTGDDDRDGVLQTPDWFDTKQYPLWTFASTRITAQSANTFAMDGVLTIRGVSHPEHLEVTATGAVAHPAYHATGQIDRKIWGMAVTRLDPVIGNPVDVTLDIQTR